MDPTRTFERTYALEDIAIRAGGDGRTVVAYAAVFDTPAEIHDQDGHYLETIDRSAFNKTIAESARNFQVFYNHGKTLYGTPSERFSLPLGVPEEVKPDGRGLMTVTRYNRTELADEVLESIRNGDIRGQSFGGRMVESKRSRGQSGGIDAIHRSQIALREYGPTPMPAYQDAGIVGVRMDQLVETLSGLNDEEKADLLRLLDTSRTGGPSTAAEAAPEGTAAAPAGPDIHPTTDNPSMRLRRLAMAGIETR